VTLTPKLWRLVLLFSSPFPNLAPFYAGKKIMLLAMRFPRDARHFMREKPIMWHHSGQRQIDEVRCHAILRERDLAQKSLQRALQANHGQDL